MPVVAGARPHCCCCWAGEVLEPPQAVAAAAAVMLLAVLLAELVQAAEASAAVHKHLWVLQALLLLMVAAARQQVSRQLLDWPLQLLQQESLGSLGLGRPLLLRPRRCCCHLLGAGILEHQAWGIYQQV